MELTDAEVALLSAEAGAAVVRRMYRTPVAHHLKVGTDFATDADLEAETAIRAVLTEHRPGDAQLGEEHGALRARVASALARRPAVRHSQLRRPACR